jgi:hypothetical protein
VRGSRCGGRTWRDRALAATGSPVGDGAGDVLSIPASAERRVSPGRNDVTEETREPQECWGIYRWEEVFRDRSHRWRPSRDRSSRLLVKKSTGAGAAAAPAARAEGLGASSRNRTGDLESHNLAL